MGSKKKKEITFAEAIAPVPVEAEEQPAVDQPLVAKLNRLGDRRIQNVDVAHFGQRREHRSKRLRCQIQCGGHYRNIRATRRSDQAQ